MEDPHEAGFTGLQRTSQTQSKLIAAFAIASLLFGTGGNAAFADESPSASAAPASSAKPTPDALPTASESPVPVESSTVDTSAEPQPANAQDETRAKGQAATTGSVVGTVFDTATNKPIAGATVYWARGPFTRGSVGVTRSNGAFSATGLTPGKYSFDAFIETSRESGFSFTDYPNYIPHYVFGAEGQPPTSGVIVTVTAGEETEAAVPMDPGAMIKGSIVDERGKPYSRRSTIVEAHQFVIDYDEDYWGNELGNGLTANGKFQLAPLDPTEFETGFGGTNTFSVVVKTCTTIRGKQDCVQSDEYQDDVYNLEAGKTRNARVKVGFEFDETPRASISGERVKGKTLRANPRDWEPLSASRKYRWMRDGVPIGGATKRSYTLKSKDVGKRISVRVYGYRDHFDTAGQNSRKTATIRAR